MNHDYIGSFWQCQMSQKLEKTDGSQKVSIKVIKYERLFSKGKHLILVRSVQENLVPFMYNNKVTIHRV